MRLHRIIPPAIAVMVLVAPLRAQSSREERALRALDSLWARSYATHDTATALKLYDAALVMTATNGSRKSREQEMGDVRATEGLVLEYFRTTPSAVLVFDGGGVVVGVAEWRFTYRGNTQTVRRAYTHTYARGGPLGWRIVAVHMGNAPAG